MAGSTANTTSSSTVITQDRRKPNTWALSNGLDQFVNKAIKDWEVPLAIAIVKSNSTM